MTIQVIDHTILYHDRRYFSAFPAIAPCGDGQMLVFRRARDHRWLTTPGRRMTPSHPDFNSVDHIDSRSEIVRLDLNTRMEPISDVVALPTHPEAVDQDGNLVCLPDGRLMQSSFLWYPVLPEYADHIKSWRGGYYAGSLDRTGVVYLFWGSYVRFSSDHGQTWSPHKMLPVPKGLPDVVPGKQKSYGGALRGRAGVLSDGTILVATYNGHPAANWAPAAFCHRSEDGGLTWMYTSRIAADKTGHFKYFEPGLCVLPDDRVLAFLRTGGRDDHLVTCISSNAGRTWSRPKQHSLCGHPYDSCVLPDGRLLLVYGYRHTPCGVRARIIDPSMPDFGAAPEVVIREDGPTRDIGYPWLTHLSGDVYGVVYYFTDQKGVRHIAGSRLKVTL